MATLFITGANRGIGYAVLRTFAQNGYDIISVSRRKYDLFEEDCRVLERSNQIRIYHIYMEMDKPESISDGLKQFTKLGVTPDVVVNNAGILHEKILMFSTMDEIRNTFQVNYFSVVQISQYLAKAMIRGGGTIINISSITAESKYPLATAYGASKAALNRFTTSLAQELSHFKIRVNAVAVGAAKTDMVDKLMSKSKENIVAAIALKRIANPQEIADAVFYLASDKSSFITGQIIRVDGGLTI